ncbi:MAG: glycosyltransferase family 39 protein [Planctomycetota bacterium]|nr:glycosyltransferase family 39 protein [Planctomycetota bacterium]
MKAESARPAGSRSSPEPPGSVGDPGGAPSAVPSGPPAGGSGGAPCSTFRLVAGALAAAAFGFAVLAPAVFVKPVTETAEARVACVARHMLRSGDWIVPRLDERLEPRLQKPPLSYWTTAACSMAFSGGLVSEAAVALPSAISGALTCAIVWLFVRCRVGAGAAFVAACSLGTCEAFFLAGHVGTADMPMAFFATAAMLLTARRAVFGEGRVSAALLAGACTGLGWLAKGPNVLPPVLIPWIASAVADVVRRRRFDTGTALWVSGSLAVAMIIAAPWHLAVAARVPGALSAGVLELGIHLEGSGHAKPFYFYILYIPYRFLPWTPALLIWGLAALSRRRGVAGAPAGGGSGNGSGGNARVGAGHSAAGVRAVSEAGGGPAAESSASPDGGAAAPTHGGSSKQGVPPSCERPGICPRDPSGAGAWRNSLPPGGVVSGNAASASSGALTAFFGTVAIGTALVYSLVTDKRDYYVLHVFPALAILTGIWSESVAGRRGVFGKASGFCVAILGAAFGAFVAIAPFVFTSAGLWPTSAGIPLGLALAAAALAAAVAFRAGRLAAGAIYVALAATFCCWAYSGWYYAMYRRENPVQLLASTAETLVPSGAPIYTSGEPFPIMLYYFDRPVTGLSRIAEAWPGHAGRGAFFAGTMEAAQERLGLSRKDVLAVVSRENVPAGREYVIARLAPGTDWPERYRRAVQASGKSKRSPGPPRTGGDPGDG